MTQYPNARLARHTPPAAPSDARYDREHPGNPAHVNVKKVPRIPEGGGHRALRRGCGSRRDAGGVVLARGRR